MIEALLTLRHTNAHLAHAQNGHARDAPTHSVPTNRPLSRVLAARGHTLGITPNAATGSSTVHAFLGMWM